MFIYPLLVVVILILCHEPISCGTSKGDTFWCLQCNGCGNLCACKLISQFPCEHKVNPRNEQLFWCHQELRCQEDSNINFSGWLMAFPTRSSQLSSLLVLPNDFDIYRSKLASTCICAKIVNGLNILSYCWCYIQGLGTTTYTDLLPGCKTVSMPPETAVGFWETIHWKMLHSPVNSLKETSLLAGIYFISLVQWDC